MFQRFPVSIFHATAWEFVNFFLGWPANNTDGNPNLDFAAVFACKPFGFFDSITQSSGCSQLPK